jgi:hypothetical protein
MSHEISELDLPKHLNISYRLNQMFYKFSILCSFKYLKHLKN